MVNPQGDVASNILRSKYGGCSVLITSEVKMNCLALWRGLLKAAPWTVRSMQREVGDGNTTLLWYDRWLMSAPLHQ